MRTLFRTVTRGAIYHQHNSAIKNLHNATRNNPDAQLQAVISDMSGTMVDLGGCSVTTAMQEVFSRNGVLISGKVARGPMGLSKDEHIRAIIEETAVRERWYEVHGKNPDQDDVDAMYKQLKPILLELLRQPQYTGLIPGTVDTMDKLRSLGIRIGITTGFDKDMMDTLLEAMKEQGFVSDASVPGDAGLLARPHPYLIFKVTEMMIFQGLLDVHPPMEYVLTIGDTEHDMKAGEAAECWTAGVYAYSNYTDIDSLDHFKNMSPAELEDRQQVARKRLVESGADFVVPSIADIPKVVEQINCMLKEGKKPGDNPCFDLSNTCSTSGSELLIGLRNGLE